MKSKERDIDEGIDFSEEAFKKRFKRIDRPKMVDDILNENARREGKSRITTYIDSDVIKYFKQRAEEEGLGYQTLINNTLRNIVYEKKRETEKAELKEELLEDKQFLRKLKSALPM